LLILGLVLFGTAFGVYARFLGWIDGLPQLPEEFLVRRADDEPIPTPTFTPVEQKLLLAFPGGGPWHEVGYTHKIELHTKGIVLATREFSVEPDGRVRLAPFSLATFKGRPGEFPEINTVHCDVAYLEFDKPVKYVAEIGQRRIVACELASEPNPQIDGDPRRGQVHVGNNRSTRDPGDDLCLQTPGPVYYREASQPDLPLDKARPQIHTPATVKLVDRRSQPQPTTIDAQGMQVYLDFEPPEAAHGQARRPAKPRGTVSGVRRVVLPANVSMNLWMDPKEGFLASGAAKPSAGAATAPAERTNVRISTLGPFTYDVLPDADRARFDRLPPSPAQLPNNCVRVLRPQSRGPLGQSYDQLDCDALEMQFAHQPLPRPAAPAAKPAAKPLAADRSSNIEWVHAWGQHVLMTSDDEKLEAHGNDLYHDARTKTTTLKGSPEMVAVKDGNVIHAPELVLFGADAKEGQQAIARGAGHFRMLDRDGSKRSVEARWRDQCLYRKDDGHDLLTLTGDAVFEDRDNKQMLRADQLKLWLAPDPKRAAAVGPPPPGPDGPTERPRPRKLEAIGHVSARSPDLNVHDSEQLELLFKDTPPRPGDPAKAVAAAPRPGAYQAGKVPLNAPAGGMAAAVAPAKPQAASPPAKPIDLTARRIQAFLLVSDGEQNQLDTVHCEDNVRIHQDPAAPQEKPVDMRGQRVQLRHTPEGNVLTVIGTLTAPGEVHLPDLSLLGPVVRIDQLENVAEVQGVGSMQMASKTDFQGNPLKTLTDLIVTWKQGMMFNGQLARFHGNVEADQDNTSLLCENMQVYMNRPVSLNRRPGEANGPDGTPAAVNRVVCDSGARLQGVIITEREHDARGRFVKYQRVESNEVILYKDEGRMETGRGRGSVRILQLGPKGDPAGGLPRPPAPAGARPPAAPAKPVEEEYKLTWIRFDGKMMVNNSKRTVRFFENVDVLHMPMPDGDPGLKFEMDKLINKLPLGALHLRSDRLTVYSPKDAEGHPRQQMVAEGRAAVQWQDEFYGTADVIKFDEAKQQMTLEGLNGKLALVQMLRARPGEERKHIHARKIMYNRLTDTWSAEGVYSSGNN
jgi:lipopolysaccharide export system protein LptA